MTGSRPQYIHEIDALRGIAALSVACVFHLFLMFGAKFTGPLDGLPVLSWLYNAGWTMVDLFFVVSGYVFAHVYLAENALKTGVTGKSFFVARFARLYPLHILTMFLVIPPIALGVVTQGLHDNLDLYHFVLNLLMLQGSGLNDRYSFNVVSWSVSVEVLCYVLFFVAARAGAGALFLTAMFAIFVGVWLTLEDNMLTSNLGRGLSGFFAGYFAWRLRNLNIPSSVLVPCIIIPILWVPNFINFGTFLGLTAFPAAVLLAQRLPFLGARFFRWLGDRSYSIYLWHPVVYFSAKAYIPNFHGFREDHPFLLAGGAIFVVLALSDLGYRYFETPMRGLIRGKLNGQAKPRKEALNPV
ncbi:MAG: acyltransferase [Silicimonas sp.]|nr:acyltransferase [Silicimonas sp.]